MAKSQLVLLNKKTEASEKDEERYSKRHWRLKIGIRSVLYGEYVQARNNIYQDKINALVDECVKLIEGRLQP